MAIGKAKSRLAVKFVKKKLLRILKHRQKERWQGLTEEERLKIAHERILTPAVRLRAKSLNPKNQAIIFKIWCDCKTVEFLPDGTPFKVSADRQARHIGGRVIDGLNKPLILVADYLNFSERQLVARHELEEWSRDEKNVQFDQTDTKSPHEIAVRQENPRIRQSAEQKIKKYRQIRASLRYR